MPILLLKPYVFYPRGDILPKGSANSGELAKEALKRIKKKEREERDRQEQSDEDEMLLMIELLDD